MSDSPLLGLSPRIPPSNAQAEQALLGALMANNLALRHVAGFLKPKHFSDPVHGAIFDAIEGHVARGKLADPISLRAQFEHTGALDEVGGTNYLAQLMTAMVGIIDAGEYGRAIHDAWLRRQLIDVGEEIVNRAFGADPEMDGAQQIAAAVQRLGTLIGAPLVFLEGDEIVHLRDRHRSAAARMELLDPQPVGIVDRCRQRASMLNSMLPPSDMGHDEVDQAANEARDPTAERAGGEVVGGRHVVMEEPGDAVPLRGDDGEVVAWI